MHDYLSVFKDPKLIEYLSDIRMNTNIPIEVGTMSNLQVIESLGLPNNVLASIQLYEYLLYDFLLNSSFHEQLDDNNKEIIYNILNKVFDGNTEIRDSKAINTIISQQINHDKYCDLLAKRKTPDYLQIFRDINTTTELEYLRVQNGIDILLGTASKPEVLENSRRSQSYKSSIYLYEYIFYDILLKQEVHDSLSEAEKKSFITILNAICNKELFDSKKVEILEGDIATSNDIIGRWINNKKYFKLFGETELANDGDKMNIYNNDIVLHVGFINPDAIQKGIEYYKSMKKAS